MKIVVTGAVGHIGSYMIRELPNQFPGTTIVMIDNLMTQRFPSLFNLPVNADYRFVDADIATADLRPLFAGADVVIHLAAITDAAGSFGKAEVVEANNFEGTRNVVAACAATGARLIALSSTSVYGTQAKVVSEDCSPEELQPQSPYAATKLKEEELVQRTVRSDGLAGVVCRFGTIYGASPGMRFHTAVNKFCWQAAMGQPISVWNTAYDQKRPYLDLFDAGRAIAFIIRQNLFDGRVYNILSQNLTVRDIVEAIREFVPALEVGFVDSPIMNQLSYEVSCERFTSLGFAFAGDLRRGVGETLGLLRHANSARPGEHERNPSSKASMSAAIAQPPTTTRLRRFKDRFKRLQNGRGRWLVAAAATVQQTLLHRSLVRVTIDRDGDWHNRRKGITLVSPELNVTSFEEAHELVADRWCHGCELRAGDVVIDIGAGIGDDAAIFSRMVGPTGRVIAIEAHPVTYRCLTKTIAANGLANVTPLQLAVSDRDGSVSISEQTNFLSNSIVDGQSGTEVRARRLDDAFAEMDLPAARLIKMNIEGAETAAVKGASGLMAPGTRFVISCHDFKSERGDGEFFRTGAAVRGALEQAGLTVTQRTEDPRREVYWIIYGEA